MDVSHTLSNENPSHDLHKNYWDLHQSGVAACRINEYDSDGFIMAENISAFPRILKTTPSTESLTAPVFTSAIHSTMLRPNTRVRTSTRPIPCIDIPESYDLRVYSSLLDGCLHWISLWNNADLPTNYPHGVYRRRTGTSVITDIPFFKLRGLGPPHAALGYPGDVFYEFSNKTVVAYNNPKAIYVRHVEGWRRPSERGSSFHPTLFNYALHSTSHTMRECYLPVSASWMFSAPLNGSTYGVQQRKRTRGEWQNSIDYTSSTSVFSAKRVKPTEPEDGLVQQLPPACISSDPDLGGVSKARVASIGFQSRTSSSATPGEPSTQSVSNVPLVIVSNSPTNDRRPDASLLGRSSFLTASEDVGDHTVPSSGNSNLAEEVIMLKRELSELKAELKSRKLSSSREEKSDIIQAQGSRETQQPLEDVSKILEELQRCKHGLGDALTEIKILKCKLDETKNEVQSRKVLNLEEKNQDGRLRDEMDQLRQGFNKILAESQQFKETAAHFNRKHDLVQVELVELKRDFANVKDAEERLLTKNIKLEEELQESNSIISTLKRDCDDAKQVLMTLNDDAIGLEAEVEIVIKERDEAKEMFKAAQKELTTLRKRLKGT